MAYFQFFAKNWRKVPDLHVNSNICRSNYVLRYAIRSFTDTPSIERNFANSPGRKNRQIADGKKGD